MALPLEALRDAAARWGTPLYLTDLDTAAANLAAWRVALPGALVAYAVKANPDPVLLSRLVADGAGCEVAGPVELEQARRAGCPPEGTVVNGVGLDDAELASALASGALVNAESLGALDALLEARVTGGRIGLRINPALDAATHRHLATGAASAKFGIALEELPVALDRLREAGGPLASLGAHIGSAIEDVDPFAELAARLAVAEGLASARSLAPDRIDLGGGLASADPTTLERYAIAVRRHFPDSARLIVEPGRSIVAGAGWLVTRVVREQLRPSAARLQLVADAGMTELIRPMLYGADHPVHLLQPGATVRTDLTVTLSGPVCEAGDVLAPDLSRHLVPADLERVGRGALLAIGEAGAYGVAMASNYNGRLRPPQVVVEGGELRLSRRRETLEDLLSREA